MRVTVAVGRLPFCGHHHHCHRHRHHHHQQHGAVRGVGYHAGADGGPDTDHTPDPIPAVVTALAGTSRAAYVRRTVKLTAH